MSDATEPTAAGSRGPTWSEVSESRELAVGDAVGRYLIVSRLGAGGMGVVYGAYDPELDRKVALKLLRGEGGEDGAWRVRLLREAQAMAKLGHPNVIAVHDAGEHEGAVFIAMEFVEGSTVTEWCEERPRSWREVMRVFVEAGRGLAAAHAMQLVHRDFKPDNVMVARDGRVRVMDFGLARSSGEPSPVAEEPARESPRRSVDALRSDLTREGSVLGTPAYMAPEQHAGLQVGAAADQFSYCVAFYQCLYGERPFEGRTLAQIAFNVLTGKPRDPPPGARVPGWLRRVLLRGLMREALDRWPSMDALLVALGRDPSRRRRAIAWVAGAGVLAASGLGWQHFDRARANARCEREAQAIAEDWNAERSADIAARFAAQGPSYAPDTWTRAAAHLDRWAGRWAEVRRELCVATRVAHTAEPETFEAGAECLAEQRAQLVALLRLLEPAEAAAVAGAVSSAADLPRPENCADPAHLAERNDAPETHAAKQAIRGELAEFEALLSATHYEEALEVALAAATDAKAIDAGVLLARARLDEGLVLENLGRLEDAAAAQRDAYYRAGAAGHERLCLQAAAQLVHNVGVRLSRTDEAKWWAELAKMHMAQLGHERSLETAGALFAIGNLLGALGEYDDARAAYEEALEIRVEAVGETHPAVAMSWVGLGASSLDRGDFVAAKRELERALELRERAFGPDHPKVGETLNNLANVLRSMGRYDEAEPMYRRALALVEAALGPEHPDVAAPLNNMGFMYALQNRWDEAEASLKRALKLREAALGVDHPDLARQLTNLANVYRGRGDLEIAQETMERAVQLHEGGLGPDHPVLAITLINYGLLLKSRGSFPEAKAVLERALAIQARALDENHPDTAATLANLSTVELSMGLDSEALAHLERALQAMNAGAASPGHRAMVQLELGDLLWRTGGDRERALQLVTDAAGVLETRPEHAKEAERARQWLDSR